MGETLKLCPTSTAPLSSNPITPGPLPAEPWLTSRCARCSKALPDFDRYIARQPRRRRALCLPAKPTEKLNRHEEAIGEFDCAIGLDADLTWTIAEAHFGGSEAL